MITWGASSVKKRCIGTADQKIYQFEYLSITDRCYVLSIFYNDTSSWILEIPRMLLYICKLKSIVAG